MKTMFKKILSLVLCVVMIFMIGSVNPAYAADDSRQIIDSGDCGLYGDNLKWIVYSDGELEISGNGEMNQYYSEYESGGRDTSKCAPWRKYEYLIRVINIKEGVTSIGHDAIISTSIYYHKVYFPKSLKYIEVAHYDKDLFENIRGFQSRGEHIAFCYAGSPSDWDKVECRNYDVDFNANTREYEKTYIGTSLSNHIEQENYIYQKMYFNGKEPIDFCEIRRETGRISYTDGTKEKVFAHYYNDDDSATLVWSIDGESVFVNGETEKTATGNSAELVFHGESTKVKLQMISSDGEVISEDEITLTIPAERTFFQKIGDKFVEAFLLFGIIFFGVFGGTFGPMIGSIANWFHSIFN